MKATRTVLLKLWAAAVGSTVFIQIGSCDSQFPPDNAACFLGVCIAQKPTGSVDAELIVKEIFTDEAAGE